jgi:hypothetical protein
MFKKSHALALASLLGLSAFAIPSGSGSAAGLPYVQQNGGIVQSDNGLRQQVNHRYNMGYHNNGDWDNDHNWRYRHHRRGFNNFGVFVSPLVIGGGYGYNDGYYRRSGSAHVEWCLNRYRSYNPADNTWVSYSGEVHYCRSPYRY